MRPALVLSLGTALAAQAPELAPGIVGLRQACLDAATDAVVLNVAAHPDDESSRTNVILRRKWGLRVVTVYVTNGDGGQNAVGREIGPELAAIRVRETLRAAAISDVEVRWLGMDDFGYSKTLEETLRAWDGDKLLEAMRAVVDEVNPDVVFTNHNLTQGHGHHRAAFWAIQRVLAERPQAGRRVVPLYARCNRRDAQLLLDPTELDLIRGETYARQAHRSWTRHVSQGPWREHNPLQVGMDHWRVVHPEGVAVDKAADLHGWLGSLFDLPVFAEACRARSVDAAALRADLLAFATDRAAAEHKARAKELLPVLLRLHETLLEAHMPAAVPALRRLDRRIDALERVLLAAHAVAVETWLEREEVPEGGRGKAFVVLHGVAKIGDLQVRCGGVPAEPAQAVLRQAPEGTTPELGGIEAAAGAAAAEPAPESPQPKDPGGRFAATFDYPGNGDVVEASGPAPAWIALDVSFTLDEVPIHVRPRLWFTPVPRVELRWDREAVMLPRGQVVERVASATVRKHQEHDLHRPVRLGMGPGVRAESTPGRLALTREHSEARLIVRMTLDGGELTAPADLKLQVGDELQLLRIVPADVTVPPGLTVGLVRGPDDTLERALEDLGVACKALGPDDLAVAELERFGALLLDMRAYHHRPELAEVRDRILRYCRAGGRVVAMYHKPAEWNERPGHPSLAPFPLQIGSERVTEEGSPVTLLQPEHRIWNHPHRIGADEFAGWVQERGLNFPKTWDPAWTPLLELKDSGDEKPHQGALLHTRYGQGDYVYCSLVLYRQLRMGHAGAARILINLLSR